MATRRKMLNFRDEVLERKGMHIKRRYRPTKFQKEYKIESVEDILNILFNYKQNATVYAHDSRIVQCKDGRGRSYYDAYMLCMHYFPEVTFKEMYHTLKKAVDPCHERWAKRIGQWRYVCEPFWTCSTIGRARFNGNYKIKFK